MDNKLLNGKNVIVQGITGSQGSFHTRAMVAAGTNIIAGTSPNKAGQEFEGIPVYGTIADIQKDIHVDATVIFVPAAFAKNAVMEAISADIPLIVCITEGVPIHDMLYIKQLIGKSSSRMIGPNSPGILLPGVHNLGIIPAHLAMPGKTAVVSRSGTLTYEAMDLLTKRGIGQKYIIGIGGDMIQGSTFVDCMKMFEEDDDVQNIVMIGEIGGTSEIEAANYIQSNVSKPVYAYVAGHSAPTGVQLGHAGAILGSNSLEAAGAKTDYLETSGAITADSLATLISKIEV